MQTIMITITSCLITAIVGGLVSLMFWRVQKKIEHLEQKSDQHNHEQIEMRKRERELLLANADLTLVIARKEQGYDVNGDLAAAENYLKEKKHDVQVYTRAIAIEHIEEA